MDQVRLPFGMLTYHDPFGIFELGCQQVNMTMLSELVEFFEPVSGPNTLRSEDTLAKIHEWFLLEEKLNLLCEDFGPGYIFFAGFFSILSPDL